MGRLIFTYQAFKTVEGTEIDNNLSASKSLFKVTGQRSTIKIFDRLATLWKIVFSLQLLHETAIGLD